MQNILVNRRAVSCPSTAAKRTPYQGVGLNDAWFVTQWKDVSGTWRQDPSYSAWSSMLKRVYSEKVHKQSPIYVGCSVDSEWLTFSNFDSWYLPRYVSGWHLEKDILLPGNKTYGPDNCVVVPRWINNFLHWHEGKVKTTGWTKKGKKFVTQCSNPSTGAQEIIGAYDTDASAHAAWVGSKILIMEQHKELIDSIDARLWDAIYCRLINTK